jgi:hypothetical protein
METDVYPKLHIVVVIFGKESSQKTDEEIINDFKIYYRRVKDKEGLYNLCFLFATHFKKDNFVFFLLGFDEFNEKVFIESLNRLGFTPNLELLNLDYHINKYNLIKNT